MTEQIHSENQKLPLYSNIFAFRGVDCVTDKGGGTPLDSAYSWRTV